MGNSQGCVETPKINSNPNSPVKMGLGLALVGAGFLVFGFSSNSMNSEAQVPMIFLVAGVFIYTIGELFLSPIGLSKVLSLHCAVQGMDYQAWHT